MAIQKNIGKNTIGDNNKMSVSLHVYNMSTHDLSTIVRSITIHSTRMTMRAVRGTSILSYGTIPGIMIS